MDSGPAGPQTDRLLKIIFGWGVLFMYDTV